MIFQQIKDKIFTVTTFIILHSNQLILLKQQEHLAAKKGKRWKYLKDIIF